MSVLCLNARSIRNKLCPLKAMIATYNPSVVAITETWLHSEIPDIVIDNYSCFRCDRALGVGGGVLLLVKNSISAINITPPVAYRDSVWCSLSFARAPSILMGCIYRSPSSSDDNDRNLNNLLSHMSHTDFGLKIILGDFNFPDVNWHLSSGNLSSENFRHAIDDCYLSQIVREPTRGSAILDLVFTDDPSAFEDVKVIEPLLGSDHNSILCALRFSNPISPSLRTPTFPHNLARADWPQYAKLIDEVKWDDMFSTDDPNDMWNFLKETLLSAAREAIPTTKAKFYSGVRVSGEVKRALNARRKIFRKYRNCSAQYASDMLVKADARLKSALNDARVQREQKIVLCLKDSPREFWKHVHKSLKNRPVISSVLNNDDNLTSTDVDTANAFNKFFSQAFASDNSDVLPSFKEVGNSKIDTIDFTVNDLRKFIDSLPQRSSPGPDGVPNALLTNAGPCLLPVLHRFFRHLFDNGVLPSDWLLANVTPIYKKGSRTLCGNYRPISLTSTSCKIAERLIKCNIIKYLQTNNLLSSSQHGFLPHRSCLSSLLIFLETISDNLDQGIPSNTVYIDFSKAFDSISHRRLLIKLKAFGVTGPLFSWIECFVTRRKQRVVVHGESSSWLPVTSGVPQGSVLGPLLFLLFIDDIDHCFIHSTILKYADDVRIIARDTHGALLQEDLDRLVAWSKEWFLNINLKKCKILHFGSNNGHKDFYLGNDILSSATEEIDLGVCVTDNFKPSRQCHLASVSAQRVLNLIRISFHHLDIRAFTVLYKTMVRPRLEHCITAWSPYLRKDIDLLERVQRRATRTFPQVRDLPYRNRLAIFHLTSLSTRRLRFDLITVFKIFKGLVDLPLNHFFEIDEGSSTRGHPLKLKIKFARLSSRQCFFSYRVVSWWNKLPVDCVLSRSLDSFKANLDAFLVSTDQW